MEFLSLKCKNYIDQQVKKCQLIFSAGQSERSKNGSIMESDLSKKEGNLVCKKQKNLKLSLIEKLNKVSVGPPAKKINHCNKKHRESSHSPKYSAHRKLHRRKTTHFFFIIFSFILITGAECKPDASKCFDCNRFNRKSISQCASTLSECGHCLTGYTKELNTCALTKIKSQPPLNVTGSEGSSVEVGCEFTGDVKCVWEKDGMIEDIDNNDRYRFQSENISLSSYTKDCTIIIKQLSHMDEGQWQSPSISEPSLVLSECKAEISKRCEMKEYVPCKKIHEQQINNDSILLNNKMEYFDDSGCRIQVEILDSQKKWQFVEGIDEIKHRLPRLFPCNFNQEGLTTDATEIEYKLVTKQEVPPYDICKNLHPSENQQSNATPIFQLVESLLSLLWIFLILFILSIISLIANLFYLIYKYYFSISNYKKICTSRV